MTAHKRVARISTSHSAPNTALNDYKWQQGVHERRQEKFKSYLDIFPESRIVEDEDHKAEAEEDEEDK